MGRHMPEPDDMKPSGQLQIMVRTGSVGVAWQLAGLLQGSSTPQGSLHTPLKQASTDGQSPSVLHSGTSSGRQVV